MIGASFGTYARSDCTASLFDYWTKSKLGSTRIADSRLLAIWLVFGSLGFTNVCGGSGYSPVGAWVFCSYERLKKVFTLGAALGTLVTFEGAGRAEAVMAAGGQRRCQQQRCGT